MSKPDLSSIEEAARAELDPKFAAREVAITNGRRVIRFSAKAIRAGHRGELSEAGTMLAQARELLAESTAAIADHPDIKIGILNDAAKEYAEARLFLAMAGGEELPAAAELGTRMAPYLNGLGEAVGELRRRLLDQLREEDFAEAERLAGDHGRGRGPSGLARLSRRHDRRTAPYHRCGPQPHRTEPGRSDLGSGRRPSPPGHCRLPHPARA